MTFPLVAKNIIRNLSDDEKRKLSKEIERIAVYLGRYVERAESDYLNLFRETE